MLTVQHRYTVFGLINYTCLTIGCFTCVIAQFTRIFNL
ncbi:unnamed protein product [Schistosoma margrebowiei]|uniref:Uncharacterized protein n=1 Tax=Schistosoma margrebowiei TaxID=48269 RepID=A0A3P7ZSS3_9TREM|nr:unnamed protein product [Schistosoma margrebowiei]